MGKREKAALERIKAFGMTNQILMEDLAKISSAFAIDLLPEHVGTKDPEAVYYPQFDAEIRREATIMAEHYAIFYSLEKSIRALVSETIEDAENNRNWWLSKRVPESVKIEVRLRIQKEVDAGVTRRSLDELDYTTFGELSVIIASNWDLFGSLFNSKKAVERVMANLNALRNPIAHCSLLADDEQLRLQLTLRDWFRLMQ